MPKSNSLQGADRYNFMMALTGYLISSGQQPISTVSEHFGVSEKELRSALITISLSGVGKYRPDELFFLDYDLLEEGIVDLSFAPTLESAPRLSAKQVAAMSAGLSYLANVVEAEDRSEIERLINLLGSGKLTEKEFSVAFQPQNPDPSLQIIRTALIESKVLKMEYRSSRGEVTKREIEPLLIESSGNDWFLRGFCRTHGEVRVFRVDRMRELEILDQAFAQRDGLVGLDGEIYSVSAQDVEVLFEVEPEGYGLIADYKPDFTFTPGEKVRVSIPIGNLGNLGPLVARYLGKVRVLAPESAKIAVRDFALSALGKNGLEKVAE